MSDKSSQEAVDGFSVADFPPPRVRLFLSLDFSGSTPFKQSWHPTRSDAPDQGHEAEPSISMRGEKNGEEDEEVHQPWLEPFAHFFPSIDENLRQAWDEIVAMLPEDSEHDAVRSLILHKRPPYASTASHQRQSDDQDRGEPEAFSNTVQARPHFYQGRGDEAIYCLKLDNEIQALVAVWAFINATEKTRHEIAKRPSWHPLNVKAAAWIAKFPVSNSEAVMGADYTGLLRDAGAVPVKSAMPAHYLLPFLFRLSKVPTENREAAIANILSEINEQDDEGTRATMARLLRSVTFAYKDYLGPQMDLGFRLAAESTPRKMMISLDLAHLLGATLCLAPPPKRGQRAPKVDQPARATETDARCRSLSDFINRAQQALRFGYEGRVALKGVRNGLPYPLFFLHADRRSAFFQAEEDIAPIKAAEPEQVQRLADAFFDSARPVPGSSLDQWLQSVVRTRTPPKRQPSDIPLEDLKLDAIMTDWQRARFTSIKTAFPTYLALQLRHPPQGSEIRRSEDESGRPPRRVPLKAAARDLSDSRD